MPSGNHVVYEFGPFRLDPRQRTLMQEGELVALAPKVFETLLLLVRFSGRILDKEEMIKTVWPDSFVEEANLSQNIFVLRKVLGDDRNGHAFIQTVPRRGYRFVAKVGTVEQPATGAPGLLSSNYWSRHSPFRSLQAFEPEDAWLFLGRDAEIDDLLAKMSRAPVLVIVGDSGSGKSSLVRAGLIPALQAGRYCHQGTAIKSWRVGLFRPSAVPFDYLAEVLPHQLAKGLSVTEETRFIADCRSKLPTSRESLRNAITALANTAGEKKGCSRILLVADQFEEIFTLTTQREVRERYVDVLLAASGLDGALPIHLVIVLRADFYSHCLEHSGLSRCLETNLYNLRHMTSERLRESIEKRLQLAGAWAETGLIDSLLQDVGSEPGNLALAEHALGQLWEKSEDPNHTLTNRSYAEMGRLRGALGRHADEVYQSLAHHQERRLAQQIFLKLVHLGDGAQDTRRRISKKELYYLGSAGVVDAVLTRLISSRLISAGFQGGETFIEIAHETLIREWPLLREWLTHNREELALERRLSQAAAEWETLQKDPGALLHGARLAQAEEWLARHSDAHPALQQFIMMSLENLAQAQKDEADQQRKLREVAEARAATEMQLREQQVAAAAAARRSALRLRGLCSLLAFLLLAAIGSAWIAHRQGRIEESHALAAQSSNVLARDRGRAMELALRSWGTARIPDAHLAVAKAFPELVAVMDQGDAIERATFSPDGQKILSAGGSHGARLWAAEDGHLLLSLEPKTGKVEDISFSPDGTRVITVNSDQTVQVWNSSSGRLLATLGTPKAAGTRFDVSLAGRAVFSPDGQRIGTAGWDNAARIWSVRDGQLITTLQGHGGVVTDINFSPNGRHIVTASWDNTVRVWSADGSLEALLSGHGALVDHAQFSPDSHEIVTTSWDRSARLWDSATGRLLAVLPHDGPVTDAEFSPDGSLVLTASDDHTSKLWRSGDGRLLFTFQHDGPVHQAQFSRDGSHIVTASNDHTAKIWSATTGSLLAVLEGDTDALSSATFSPNGRRLLTGSADHAVRLWNSSSVTVVASIQSEWGPLTRAEFSPNGKWILTVGTDHAARLWGSSDGKLQATLQANPGSFAHFSPDGKLIVTTGPNAALLYSRNDGHLLATLRGHVGRLWDAVFSPDGQRIVTAGADHTARVWDSRGHLLRTLQGHTNEIYGATFSADGQRLVTASLDHTARIWQLADGRTIAVLQGHSAPVWRAAFSPDGKRIVTASFDHTARIWDSADGRLITVLAGHSDLVDTAEFSPDGQKILTASWDHTARVWNATDGRLLATLRGHAGKIITAMFSHDGGSILTASDDHTAKLWSSSDYTLLATLSGHNDQVWQAAFSSDGRLIVTASLDQTARIWRVLTLDDVDRILAEQ